MLVQCSISMMLSKNAIKNSLCTTKHRDKGLLRNKKIDKDIRFIQGEADEKKMNQPFFYN